MNQTAETITENQKWAYSEIEYIHESSATNYRHAESGLPKMNAATAKKLNREFKHIINGLEKVRNILLAAEEHS